MLLKKLGWLGRYDKRMKVTLNAQISNKEHSSTLQNFGLFLVTKTKNPIFLKIVSFHERLKT